MYGKHYATFPSNVARKMKGNKLDKENWEILRGFQGTNEYAIENDKDNYILSVRKKKDYQPRVEIMVHMIKRLHCDNVVSLGVGCGLLEFMLKERLPKTHFICTDFTNKSIVALERVSNCNEFRTFDILNGDYDKFNNGTCLLMHRVSTEFSYDEWERIFKKIYDSKKIKYVIFIPTENATIKEILDEKIQHMKNLLLNRRDFDCGWKYSKKSILDFMTMKRKKKHIIKKIMPVDNTAVYLIRTDGK